MQTSLLSSQRPKMPLPAEDSVPESAPTASSSTEAPPSQVSTQELLDKFRQLGQEAAAEDDEDDDEVEDEVGGGAAVAEGSGAAGDGEGKKKKKKKKKGKASKAVAKLKSVICMRFLTSAHYS